MKYINATRVHDRVVFFFLMDGMDCERKNTGI